MWTAEHSIVTTASPEQIWRLWADVATWPEWNGDIERIELIGPFASGGRILMLRSTETRSICASPRPSSLSSSWMRPTSARSSCGRRTASSVSTTSEPG